MPAFTERKLKAFAPRITSEFLRTFLLHNADDILIKAGITSALTLQHFMGQTFVETAGYTTMSENLHYTAARLMQVWPLKFPTLAVAKQYAGDPIKTANYVYGGRMGNNNQGDGWKYRGGGLIDLTGSYNYRAQAAKIGVDIWRHPDLVRDPQTALQIAAQFFKACGALAAAEEDSVREVTRFINGGYNGLAQRQDATDRAGNIFIDDPSTSSTIRSAEPFGLVGDFENSAQTPAEGYTATLQAPAEGYIAELGTVKTVEIPMTAEQAKKLQTQLKQRNYTPGEIDGNINSPSTVGAIAQLQKQQGIPVTGVIDDVTEDAIQDAPPKVVTEARENDNAKTLRAKGSHTIAAADNINFNTHGVTVGGLSTLGVGITSIFATIGDQADQLTKITDHIPGLSEKIAFYITSHLGYIALVILGGGLLYAASRLYHNSGVVISERVKKSRTGEDMSH